MNRRVTALAVFGWGLGLTACNPAAEDPRAVGDAGQRGAACTESLDPEACGDLSALLLPAALPSSRGNAHADSFDAALLGFRVFFDARFSKDGTVRCESCHSVDHRFADAEPVPVKGLGTGVRNSPTVLNAARHRTTFWDGRVDSLWSQPLEAFENPDEMGTTRLEIAHLVQTLYAREYQKAFGPLLDFSDAARFPAAGKPGDTGFDSMTAGDQLEVNRVVANLGKALEAYMRKLAAGPSHFDRSLALRLGVADAGYGPANAYSAGYPASDGGAANGFTRGQLRGLVAFVNAGCSACHGGPQLSDDALHDIGVPPLPGHEPDEGLTAAAIGRLEHSPFNAAGPFFDGGPLPVEIPELQDGAFRTPSLRNLRDSAPYGHNGVFATLAEVVDFHLDGGGRLDQHDLSAEDRAALIEFLESLEGDYPALPWGQWPNGNG